jgi:uncharacterized protein
MLAFNVAQLLKEGTGAYRQCPLEGELPALDDNNPGPIPVRGEAHLVRTVRGVLAQGDAEVRLIRVCRRCGETTEGDIRLEIEEEFIPSLDIETGASLPITDDEDRDLVIDDHHVLDILPVLGQLAVAAVITPSLCRDDCRGLCPLCGSNLNAQVCDCDRRPVDSRLSALAGLLTADGTASKTTTD